MNLKTTISIAATAAVITVGSQANATPVDLTNNGALGPRDSMVTTFENGRGGPFDVDVAPDNQPSPVTSFVAWCIDLAQTIGTSTYDYNQSADNGDTGDFGAPEISDAEETQLSQLFTQNYSALGAFGSSVLNTAFQMAIWEIIYEDEGNSLDVTAGDFAESGGGNAAARAQANTWLTALAGPADYTFDYFLSNRRQDLLAGSYDPTPVPLPAGLLLMLGGLGAFAVAKRRQART